MQDQNPCKTKISTKIFLQALCYPIWWQKNFFLLQKCLRKIIIIRKMEKMREQRFCTQKQWFFHFFKSWNHSNLLQKFLRHKKHFLPPNWIKSIWKKHFFVEIFILHGFCCCTVTYMKNDYFFSEGVFLRRKLCNTKKTFFPTKSL